MANSLTPLAIALSFAGGMLPALIWLWFWLREDPHPEPRRMLAFTFFAGMAAAPIALFLEQLTVRFGTFIGLMQPGAVGMGILVVWAFIEETVKYVAAKKTALERGVYNEPVDALIYMITAALGFAALENILFLLRVFNGQGILYGLVTGDLRFLGATLLHVVASSAVGLSLAYSFFHPSSRAHNLVGGILTATFLHTLFNLLIIKKGDDVIFHVFFSLWIIALVVIVFFEKIKRLHA